MTDKRPPCPRCSDIRRAIIQIGYTSALIGYGALLYQVFVEATC